MALSTWDEATAQLNANLVWEGSPAKARLALEAIRWLKFNRAASSGKGGTTLQFENLDALEERLADYVATTDSTARSNRSPFVRGIPL